MPELPDVTVYQEALAARIAGRTLARVRIVSPFVLRSLDPPATELEGRVVAAVRRLGKRLVIAFEGELFIVIHLMIAGRLHWKPAGTRLSPRRDLAGFDFDSGTVTLTEAGSKHRASIHFVRGEAALAEIARLFHAVISVLTMWTMRLREQAAGAFPEKVTAFRPEMAVHGRFRQPCPVCGAPVQRIRYAENEANYCARCQTGGRLLADRALSRLLKDDWPKSLDAWEQRLRDAAI